MMEPSRYTPVPRYPHVAGLLQAAVDRNKVLSEEAEFCLTKDRNVYAFEQSTRKSAEVIADLPDALADYRDSGGEVPDRVAEFARVYSNFAIRYMEAGNTFGMGVLLWPHGSRLDDPNMLERLITDIQVPES